MGFLKRLFGGDSKPGSRGSDADSNAIIYYVKVRKCGAIARVRVDTRNDLSLDDDGENYVVRKQVVDNVCYGMAEIELHFDVNRKELSRHVENGEFVSHEVWEQQEQERNAARSSNA
ncbi:MAG: hypothetical protein M1546_03925 [Chloroflexi bacterium]|nr:hypothetical protein [Chloroflexota bacterium]